MTDKKDFYLEDLQKKLHLNDADISDLSSESDKHENKSDDEPSDGSIKLSISSLESVERQNQDLIAPSKN